MFIEFHALAPPPLLTGAVARCMLRLMLRGKATHLLFVTVNPLQTNPLCDPGSLGLSCAKWCVAAAQNTLDVPPFCRAPPAVVIFFCCFLKFLLSLSDFLFPSYFSQRLLPIEAANDLFFQPPPLTPTSKVYTIRPYYPKDEVSRKKLNSRPSGAYSL